MASESIQYGQYVVPTVDELVNFNVGQVRTSTNFLLNLTKAAEFACIHIRLFCAACCFYAAAGQGSKGSGGEVCRE
jgi:hypothetical protein